MNGPPHLKQTVVAEGPPPPGAHEETLDLTPTVLIS